MFHAARAIHIGESIKAKNMMITFYSKTQVGLVTVFKDGGTHFIINHKYYNTSKTGRLENIMQKQLNSIEDYGSNVCKYAFGRSQKKHEALLFLSDKNSILMFKDKKQSNLSSKLFLP